MSRDEAIAWFRSHLVAFRCGLLDEGDDRRFRELLSTSADCRASWEEYEPMSSSLESDEHPPAALLARWTTARRDLGSAEWATLRRHVEGCDECRQDIRTLGLGPVAEPALVREGDDAQVAAGRDRAPSFGSTDARPPRRTTWWLAGWATAATAAALALWLSTRGRTEHRAAPASGSAAVVPWVEPRLVRGPGGPTTLQVPPATRRVLLPLLLPPELQMDGNLRIRVESPGGMEIEAAHVLPDAVQDGRVMLLVESAAALTPGTYRVRISGRRTDGLPGEFESLFALEHSP